MAASVHRLQLVHSATSMIMFHFFIASLQPLTRIIPPPQGEGGRPKADRVGDTKFGVDCVDPTRLAPLGTLPFQGRDYLLHCLALLPISTRCCAIISPAPAALPSACGACRRPSASARTSPT